MLRLTGEGLVLFLLPFAAYVLLLIAGRCYPMLALSGRGTTLIRVACLGFAFLVLGLLALGLFGARHHGAYVPAHMENGILVPGRME